LPTAVFQIRIKQPAEPGTTGLNNCSTSGKLQEPEVREPGSLRIKGAATARRLNTVATDTDFGSRYFTVQSMVVL